MDVLRQDLRLALRLLWKDRAFALTTILTLSLCIAANSAIFSVVRSILLRPLPYPDADRVVFMFDSFPGAGVERAGTSVPNYLDRRGLTDVLDSVAIYRFGGFRVGEGAGAEGVTAMRVTPSFFTVLRTQAARGRLFTEQEGTPGHERVAVLSHAFASRQPGGIDGIVGRTLRLDKREYTVIGVLPDEFTFLHADARVWVPEAFSEEQRSEARRYSQNHDGIARLADGATVRQVEERLHAMNVEYIERAGPLKHLLANTGYRTVVVPFHADLVRHIRGALQTLWGGVLFVLLIATVNVTNLSLTRASGRLRELATRHALGAPRARVIRQLVTETTVLTTIGGVFGVALGYWSLGTVPSLGLADIPRAHEIRMDAVVVLFTVGVSILLGVVVGAVPAVHVARLNPSSVLRDDNRTGTAGHRATFVRRGLVVAEVALAFVLLIGAGLLLESFRQLLRIDPGFTASQVLTGRVAPFSSTYPDAAALRSYTDRALERVRAIPGVTAAGVSSYLPFGWDANSSVIIPEGHVLTPGESLVSPNRLFVTPGYLETLRVPLVRGRLFTDSDVPPASAVIIVDEQLAKRFWPNVDPIGRRLYLPSSPEDLAKPGANTVWLRVVGVVKSVKLKGLVEGENARVGAYYQPYASDPSRNVGFAIRTSGSDPVAITAAVNAALTSIDPEMRLFDTFAMTERIERSLNSRRTPMLLSLGFAVVALLLASIGIYGVLAYQVGQRSREIGIRMALGSDTHRILRLILREGVVMTVAGLALGLAGAAAMRGLIASQLYGVGPLDAGVIVLVTGVLSVASLLACVGPARRAMRVDPVVALQG